MKQPSPIDAIYDRLEGVEREPTGWLLLLTAVLTAVVCVVMGARSGLGDGVAATLGYAMGFGLVLGTLAWTVLNLAFVRRRNPDAGPTHLLILLLVAVLAHAGGAVVGGASPASAAKVDAFVEAELAANKAATEAYQAKLRALEFDTLLNPEALVARGGIARSRARLDEAVTVVKAELVAEKERARQRQERISALDIPRADREAFRANIKATDRTNIEAVEQSAERLLAMLAEYRGALDVLATARWQVVDGKYAFERAGELAAFQARLDAIRRLGAEVAKPAPAST